MKLGVPKSDKLVLWTGIWNHPGLMHPRLFYGYVAAACYQQQYGHMTPRSLLERWASKKAVGQLVELGALLEPVAGHLEVNPGPFGMSGRAVVFFAATTPEPASKRRARTPRKVTLKLRWSILRRDGFRCVYCGADGATAKLHVDHVVPVSAGGTNEDTNLVTACEACNLGKADSTELATK